ncbi:MAG TPA: hypothetical protein ENO12_03005 [Thermoplasmatales archaeon]|nr:hypothetical protein [Thermoplasmatales archaeon]
MAKRKAKKDKKSDKDTEPKKDTIEEMQIAYRSIEDKKKFIRTIFLPLLLIGILVMCLPVFLQMLMSTPLQYNPITFILGGSIPIILGVFLSIYLLEEQGI